MTFEDEIALSVAISRERGACRLPHLGKARMTGLLRGTRRQRRIVGPAEADQIAKMEASVHAGSLRLEMRRRVRTILFDGCLPVTVDDIHALATDGLQDMAMSLVARAYLTNSVAWGLSDLIRSSHIEKLDRSGNVMRNEDGSIKRGRAHFYRATRQCIHHREAA